MANKNALCLCLLAILALAGCVQQGVAVDENFAQETATALGCSGNAECFRGIVYSVIDGDTIKVVRKWGEEPLSIRFALVNTPEKEQKGYEQAKNFTAQHCIPGSEVIIDQDDGEVQGSYGRMVALPRCSGDGTANAPAAFVNMSEALLDSNLAFIYTYYCATSEFADELWAKKYGC